MKRRLINFLYNLDRAEASLNGAPPQETISSQIGRAAIKGKWWGRAGRVVLDSIQPNHCENAVKNAAALDKAYNGFQG